MSAVHRKNVSIAVSVSGNDCNKNVVQSRKAASSIDQNTT